MSSKHDSAWTDGRRSAKEAAALKAYSEEQTLSLKAASSKFNVVMLGTFALWFVGFLAFYFLAVPDESSAPAAEVATDSAAEPAADEAKKEAPAAFADPAKKEENK